MPTLTGISQKKINASCHITLNQTKSEYFISDTYNNVCFVRPRNTNVQIHTYEVLHMMRTDEIVVDVVHIHLTLLILFNKYKLII